MAIGGALGALVGQTKPTHKQFYSTHYAAVGAAVAGVYSALTSSDSSLKLENERLKIRVSDFEKRLEPKLIAKGSNLFSSPMPKDVQGLMEPGEWKRYKMDEWVQDPNVPNTWVRQVEMLEVIPPTPR